LLPGSNGEIAGIMERSRARTVSSPDSIAETHLRLLVQQIPVIFWTTDLRLRITSHWGSSFGKPHRSRNKILGRTVHAYLRCTESRETPVKQHLQALLGMSSRFEYRRGKRIFDLSLDPLRDASGAVIGCAGMAQDITGRKKTEEEILHRATHDGLTGLANYREFFESLEREVRRASRTQQSFALLLLDLDDLKSINDRFGHLRGNLALKRLARVMKESCRSTDLSSRYGGDEFAVLLIDADSARAEQVAARISYCLQQQPEHPPLSVSIGLAVYPQNGLTGQDLLESADQSLYKNKKSSRRTIAVQTP